MNFARWNRIGRGEERTLKKISELEVHQRYRVEDIRKTPTKYGDKVTVCLVGKIYCYLPAKLSELLLAEEEVGLIEIQTQLTKEPIYLRRLEPRGRFNPVEFLPEVPEDMPDVV